MALANFFDKAALAASHVLQNFDPAAFSATVASHVVGLAFDSAGAGCAEGMATLDLCARLLARLYPSVALIALDDFAEAVFRRTEMSETMRAINPNIDVATNLESATICIVVGGTPLNHPCAPAIYVGSDGWTVSVSAAQPVGSGASGNPFGAGSAACFGAANVFRHVFSNQLPAGRLDEGFCISLLDLHAGNPDKPNAPWTGADLGECHLVGLGAIGNGAVWALSQAKRLSGTIHIIDHDTIELTNLQRYVLAGQSDVGRPKVDLASAVLAGSVGINVLPHPTNWSGYLDGLQNWHLDRVAVALDTAADRCDVQSALPRRIVNAWTHPGELGISRHGFADGRACLMCLYLPKGKKKDLDVLIAEALGMGDKFLDIRARLQGHIPCDNAFVNQVEAVQGMAQGSLAAFVGEQVDVFYRKAVCGGVMLQLGGKPGVVPQDAEVPLAFQSALAGILLAADIVAEAAEIKSASAPNISKIDLLRPLGKGELSLQQLPTSSPLCVCKDGAYIDAYTAKYPLPS